MPSKMESPHLRVRYHKDGRLAYLGHLEVLNTVNRSVRRSGLPFSVGNGFARRIRLQFSQALPVGASSAAEYYDLILNERVEPDVALALLRAATPPGLGPDAVTYVDPHLPALEAWLTRSDWKIEFPATEELVAALDANLTALKEKGELRYMRGDKPKSIDLGAALVAWELAPATEGGEATMLLKTRSSNLGALRPATLFSAAFALEGNPLGEVPPLRVQRLGQWHEAEDGLLVEPMESIA